MLPAIGPGIGLWYAQGGSRPEGCCAVEALLALEPGGHWVWSVIGLLSIPLLIVLNGLFVATEFSLVSVRKTRIEELVRQGVKGARSAEAALRHLDRSIAATQLGITLASIALGWTG